MFVQCETITLLIILYNIYLLSLPLFLCFFGFSRCFFLSLCLTLFHSPLVPFFSLPTFSLSFSLVSLMLWSLPSGYNLTRCTCIYVRASLITTRCTYQLHSRKFKWIRLVNMLRRNHTLTIESLHLFCICPPTIDAGIIKQMTRKINRLCTCI